MLRSILSFVTHPDFLKYFKLADLEKNFHPSNSKDSVTRKSISTDDCYCLSWQGPAIEEIPEGSLIFVIDNDESSNLVRNKYNYTTSIINELKEKGHCYVLALPYVPSGYGSTDFRRLRHGALITNVEVGGALSALTKVTATPELIKYMYYLLFSYMAECNGAEYLDHSRVGLGLNDVGDAYVLKHTNLPYNPKCIINEDFTKVLLEINKDDYFIYKLNETSYFLVVDNVPSFIINLKLINMDDPKLEHIKKRYGMSGEVAIMTISILHDTTSTISDRLSFYFRFIINAVYKDRPNLYLLANEKLFLRLSLNLDFVKVGSEVDLYLNTDEHHRIAKIPGELECTQPAFQLHYGI